MFTIDKRGLKNSFTYDALQHVTNLAFNSNNVSGYDQSSITYTYDAADRVTQMVDSGGSNPNTQQIGYDLLDNVTSQQTPEGATTYQCNWPIPSSMTGPGQPTVNYNFDAVNRLTSVSQQVTRGTLSSVSQYDAADRPTCVTLPNGVIATYTYDADSRVTSITYGVGGSCSSPPNNL